MQGVLTIANRSQGRDETGLSAPSAQAVRARRGPPLRGGGLPERRCRLKAVEAPLPGWRSRAKIQMIVVTMLGAPTIPTTHTKIAATMAITATWITTSRMALPDRIFSSPGCRLELHLPAEAKTQAVLTGSRPAVLAALGPLGRWGDSAPRPATSWRPMGFGRRDTWPTRLPRSAPLWASDSSSRAARARCGARRPKLPQLTGPLRLAG